MQSKFRGLITEVLIWFFIVIGIGLIIVACTMPFTIKQYYQPLIKNYQSIADLGPIGDFIGGTTVAFLTAASVIFLLATIIMQRKEIKISQQSIIELVKQTEASVDQAEQARKETKITNQTMKHQQFESTFFNMLSLHHQIVNGVNFKHLDGLEVSGRDAIAELRNIAKKAIILKSEFDITFNESLKVKDLLIRGDDFHTIDEEIIKTLYSSNTINQEMLDEIYGDFHDLYGNLIGHYMRNNYRIVKFIVNNIADSEEEQKKVKLNSGRELIVADIRYYFGILRAQWSEAEFELILINALYKKNHKFKNLILKYDALDILEKNSANKKEFLLKKSMKKFKAFQNLIYIKEK